MRTTKNGNTMSHETQNLGNEEESNQHNQEVVLVVPTDNQQNQEVVLVVLTVNQQNQEGVLGGADGGSRNHQKL